MAGRRILILGGTGEAVRLAERLVDFADWEVTTSLAGRTTDPVSVPGDVRVGGFGGAEALAAYLATEGMDALIDATHPFAARISENAAEAGRLSGVPTARLTRPAWSPVEGDDWRRAESLTAAARLVASLGLARERVVFLTVGRRDLAAFAALSNTRFLVRSIERPDELDLLTQARWISARGPFRLEDEIALMRAENVGCVVSKNAGGDATRAKLDAARELGLPVAMIQRPAMPLGRGFETVEQVEAWLREVVPRKV